MRRFFGGAQVAPRPPPRSEVFPTDAGPPTNGPADPLTVSGASLSPAIYGPLTALDDRLIEVLGAGDIRLVRSAWLLAQPAGYRIVRRQDLEALERTGVSPSPLLRPDEAVALVREGRRCVGALTYGWCVAGRIRAAARNCS